MPQIPDAYQSTTAATANRRIIGQPTLAPDTSIGDALQKVGNVGLEIASRIQKANVDREVVTANRLAREQYEKAKFDLDQNRDIPDEQIEIQLRETGDAIITKAGEGISSGSARDLWSENAKTNLLVEGDVWARKTAQTRSIDRVKAGHITATADLETKAGDLSISSDAYDKSLQEERGAINRNRDRGIFDDSTAATLVAGLDKLALKDRTMRWSANIDALVKDGRVAEAQAMFDTGAGSVDPDARAQVKKGLEGAKEDYRIVSTTDQLWARARGDYAKFVKETGNIKDAILRTKVEERGDRMRLMANQAENERQDGLQEQMWAHVQGGGTVMNAPPSLRAAIDPDRLGSIRAFESARDWQATLSGAQKAAWADRSLDAKQQLDTMPPAIFLKPIEQWPPQAKVLYDAMDPDRQRAVRQSQIDMKEKGQTQDAAMSVYRDLVSRAKRLVPSDWKLSTETVMGEKDGLEFSGQLYALAKRYATEGGGKAVTEKDAREIVARALNSYKPYTLGMFGGGQGFGLPPDLLAQDAVARLGPDFDVGLALRAQDMLRKRLGREPNSQELASALAMVGAK